MSRASSGSLVEIEYRGSPPFASMLAQMLSDEGLTVDFEPPTEDRGTGDVVTVVVLYVGAKVLDKAFDLSLDKLIERAVQRFKSRVPKAEVTIWRKDSPTDGSE